MTTPETKQGRLQLRLVFFQEGQRWVAQCVEYDLNASGRDLQDAEKEFFWTLFGEIVVQAELGKLNPEDPFGSLPKGLPSFEAMFLKARPLGGSQDVQFPPGIPHPGILKAISTEQSICA